MSHHGLNSGEHVGRRQFLAASAAAPAVGLLATSYVSAQEPKAAAGQADSARKWGVPGPYPGRVIESATPG